MWPPFLLYIFSGFHKQTAEWCLFVPIVLVGCRAKVKWVDPQVYSAGKPYSQKIQATTLSSYKSGTNQMVYKQMTISLTWVWKVISSERNGFRVTIYHIIPCLLIVVLIGMKNQSLTSSSCLIGSIYNMREYKPFASSAEDLHMSLWWEYTGVLSCIGLSQTY